MAALDLVRLPRPGWRATEATRGYQPADEPTLEVFRNHPLDIGWETLDIDCCLPVRPLRRR